MGYSHSLKAETHHPFCQVEGTGPKGEIEKEGDTVYQAQKGAFFVPVEDKLIQYDHDGKGYTDKLGTHREEKENKRQDKGNRPSLLSEKDVGHKGQQEKKGSKDVGSARNPGHGFSVDGVHGKEGSSKKGENVLIFDVGMVV